MLCLAAQILLFAPMEDADGTFGADPGAYRHRYPTPAAHLGPGLTDKRRLGGERVETSSDDPEISSLQMLDSG